MRAFEYAAADATGRTVVGTAWAASDDDLDRLLDARGLVLTRARPVGDGAARALRMPPHELTSLTTQLATVTGAGLPLVEGLRGIGERLESRAGRRIVRELVSALEAGRGLSEAMAVHPRTFGEVYRASVRAGEESGALERVLERLAAHLEWTRSIRATTVQALVYPAILCVAIAGLVGILLFFVLPRIVGMFPGGEADLPAQTRLVLGVSAFARANAAGLGAGALAAAAGALVAARRPAGRRVLDGLLLRVPRLGTLVRQLATSRFASTASILHSAGCDAFTVLEVSGAACGNAALRAAFARATERVRRGATLADALDAEAHADPLLVQMVSVGERTGSLDGCLARLVAHYDEEVPRRVKRFLTLLEPGLLVVAGAVVGFVVLSALLPVFDLYQRIG